MKISHKYIGIDPDVDKSGVAIICGEDISLYNMKFFELFDFLKSEKDDSLIVVVEGGWLNKSNWHKQINGSSAINAKIGQHTGANHETGKKIVEMLEYLKISVRIVRPTKTKVKAPFFKMVSKINYRTNQEQRDAYMLIHGLI